MLLGGGRFAVYRSFESLDQETGVGLPIPHAVVGGVCATKFCGATAKSRSAGDYDIALTTEYVSDDMRQREDL